MSILKKAFEIYESRKQGYADWQIANHPMFSFRAAFKTAWDKRKETQMKEARRKSLTEEEREEIERLKRARADLDYLPSGMFAQRRRDEINFKIQEILGFIE